MKREKQKKIIKNKTIWIMMAVMCVGVTAIVPLLLDKFIFANSYPSVLSNGEWAGFLGSYIGSFIGSIATIGAVLITISWTNKSNQEQRRMEKMEEKENKRLSIKPFFDLEHRSLITIEKLGDNDILLYCEEGKVKEQRYKFDQKDEIQIQTEEYAYLKFRLVNAGAGSAINMVIDVNGTFSVPYVMLKDDKAYIYFKVLFGQLLKQHFSLVLKYSDTQDLAKYYQKMSFTVEKKDSSMCVSKIEKSKQKFKRKFAYRREMLT